MQLPICLSICFHSIFATNWPLTLNFCLWVGHDHSSQGIEGQHHRSRSRSWVRLMQSVWPQSMAVFFLIFFLCWVYFPQYQAKRLAGKSVSEMTYLVLSGMLNLYSTQLKCIVATWLVHAVNISLFSLYFQTKSCLVRVNLFVKNSKLQYFVLWMMLLLEFSSLIFSQLHVFFLSLPTILQTRL